MHTKQVLCAHSQRDPSLFAKGGNIQWRFIFAFSVPALSPFRIIVPVSPCEDISGL